MCFSSLPPSSTPTLTLSLVTSATRRYVIKDKAAAADDAESNRVHYKFGSRYYAEFGRQQMVKSYYMTIDEPVDGAALRDAVRDENETYVNVEEDEEAVEAERQAQAGQNAAVEAGAVADAAVELRPKRGATGKVQRQKAQVQEEEEEADFDESRAPSQQQKKRRRE